MSDANKTPSREEVLELIKALREEVKPVTAHELAKGLGASIRDAIATHQAVLEKMRTIEVGELKKNKTWGATGEAPAAAAPMAMSAPSMCKTVFDVLKPKAPVTKGEDRVDENNGNDPEKRLTDDGVLPNTKLPEAGKQTEQGKGSGGQTEKSESTIFALLKKNLNLEKGFAGPKLGGKDTGSKMMTNDAVSAGAKAATAKPAGPGLPKPKLPTMEEHAARANSYADFMPSPGKFNKAEWDAEECPYCGKPMSQCECK